MTELENAIDEAAQLYCKAHGLEWDELPAPHQFQIRALAMSMLWPALKVAKAQGWEDGYETAAGDAVRAFGKGRTDWRASGNPYRD